jgi:hypothetical protein
VVRDYLDFRFHTAGETDLVLEVRKKSGEDWEVELERAEGEDFGTRVRTDRSASMCQRMHLLFL